MACSAFTICADQVAMSSSRRVRSDDWKVARKSIAALADITAVAHEVAKATFAQARNAHMDELDDAGELSPDAVLAWEQDDYVGRQLVAVAKATEGVRRACSTLAERAAHGA